MSKDEHLRSEVEDLLDTQLIAVLNTIGPDEPYSCLVSFDVTSDLNYVFFCTKRERRKYRNISHNSRVSLVVDNRNNEAFDLMNTKVITIIGFVQDIQGPERWEYISSLQRKHPYLHDFFEEADTALLLLKVDYLYLIDNFERVRSVMS